MAASETNSGKGGRADDRKMLNENVSVASWYVNKHRVLERIGIQNLPVGFLEQLNVIKSDPISQGLLVTMLSPVVVDWVRRQKIPPLEELLVCGTLQQGSTFTYDGKLISKGLSVEREGDASLRMSLKEFGDARTLVIQFHTDGLTTSSARSALQRQPSVFVVAYVEAMEAEEIRCRPYVIGDLLKEYGSMARSSVFVIACRFGQNRLTLSGMLISRGECQCLS